MADRLAGVSYDPSGRTTPELLGDWAAVMRALRERGVIRTNNNPVGDIAEFIVAAHVQGERSGSSQAGWDVKAPNGDLIQVKGARQTADNNRSKLGAIRKDEYHYVIAVIFDEEFRVTEALRIPRDVVEELYPITEHTNAIEIRLTKGLRADPRVESFDLSDAAAMLDS
jgi:hypothetical protein